MHKNFDFTQHGGFPLEQDVLAFMQDGYGDLSDAISKTFGDNTIVAGVTAVSGGYTSGWIVYNNELLPVIAGNGSQGELVTDTEELQFADLIDREVKFNKYVRIGSTGEIAINSLTRKDIDNLNKTLINLNSSFNALRDDIAKETYVLENSTTKYKYKLNCKMYSARMSLKGYFIFTGFAASTNCQLLFNDRGFMYLNEVYKVPGIAFGNYFTEQSTTWFDAEIEVPNINTQYLQIRMDSSKAEALADKEIMIFVDCEFGTFERSPKP